MELLYISKTLYPQEPLAADTQGYLRFYLTTNESDRRKQKTHSELISSSLTQSSWLPHYYIFASPAQYWFELSSYPPSEHLIKELNFVLKPSKRAGKGKKFLVRYRCKVLPKTKYPCSRELTDESQRNCPPPWDNEAGCHEKQVGGGGRGMSWCRFLLPLPLTAQRFLPRTLCSSPAPPEGASTSPHLHISFPTHTRLLCQLLTGTYTDLSWWGTYVPSLLWNCSLSTPIHCFVSTAKRTFKIYF